jgi:colanic acid/amylovoran biosynthesis glycosyltransferase
MSGRKKIMMYSDKFGSHTTTFIYNDLQELSKNYDIKYLCTERGAASFNYSDVDVVPFRSSYLQKKTFAFREKWLSQMSFTNKPFAREANKLIDAYAPDLLHCNFGIEALRLIHNLNAKNSELPIVVSFLGYDASLCLQNKAYVKRLKRLAEQKNIYALSNCSFLKKNLESSGVFFRRHDVIYTGVDIIYFTRTASNTSSDKYIFLNLAVLSYRKGQEITLKAFRKFLDLVPDSHRYQLILAGGAEFEAEELKLKKLVGELNLTNQVRFTGWVSIAASKELLNSANAYLHHSRTDAGRTEGLPTVISEAMAMELPVVSTYHAAIPEQVEEGINGYLVAENDVEDFAKKMADITSWPYLKKNREKAIEKFSIDKRVKKLTAFYDQILNKN